jgi:hypothetical protein
MRCHTYVLRTGSAAADMVITLSLLDESVQSATGPQVVELIVFGPTTNDMPQAQRGDIIELRHVLVSFHTYHAAAIA